MVPVTDADAMVDEAMAGLTALVMRPVFHPSAGHQVEIDDITQALADLGRQGLDEDAEDAERARLRSERKRLSALPAKAARTEYVPVLAGGRPLTYAAKWAAADQTERRAWLRDAGFTIGLGRPDYVLPDPGQPGDEDPRMDAYENSRALVVFRWTGDEDEGLLRGQVYGDPDPAEAAS
jgi:hypothetical protein